MQFSQAVRENTSKKVFFRLMPLLIIAYIIAFIDRTNIGMAKAAMSADIGLSAAAYGLGAGLFFLTYSTLEIPSNLLMEKLGARLWITRIMITWGLVSAAFAFCNGPTSFYILRLLLGASEAGLYPGVIFYLTYWFSQEERAKATGLFLLGVCLANMIGGPLAGVLLEMEGFLGFHGWQWMFVLEGIPACFFAAVIWFFLPDAPRDAKFLSEEEKAYIYHKLEQDKNEQNVSQSKFSFKTALGNKTFLLIVAIYFTHQFTVYGLSYFLPTIIREYGSLSNIEVGFLTTLPWICASLGGIFIARMANTPKRSKNILVTSYVVMSAGLAIGATSDPYVSMAGFCLAAFMFFVAQSVIFSIPPLLFSASMLAGGIGTLNCLGLSGGFLGPYIIGIFEGLTGTAKSGLWFGVALLALGALISTRIDTSGGKQGRD